MNGYWYLKKKRDALLASSALFWLPSGMSLDDVLGAYQFKGVSSSSVALSDLSGHGRTLTVTTESGNTPSWSASSGYTFTNAYQGKSGYLDNATLDTLNIKSAVIRFSGVSDSYDRTHLITAGGSSGHAQIMARTAIATSDGISTYAGVGYVSGNNSWDTNSTYVSSGVVGANFGVSSKLYWNGSHRGTTQRTARTEIGDGGHIGHTFGNNHAAVSDLNNAQFGGKVIVCAVFFGVALTDDQHLEVAERMAQI